MKKFKRLFTFIIFLIVLVVVCSVVLIKYCSNRVEGMISQYASVEARRVVSLIINKSVSNKFKENVDVDSMIDIIRNDKNEIEMVDFNTSNINLILSSIALDIENNLESISSGNIEDVLIDFNGFSKADEEVINRGLVFFVRLGSVTGAGMLGNIGPSIPVRVNMMGDVLCNVVVDVIDYGINNALISVGINVSVDMVINMPFSSDVFNVSVVVPVMMRVISGSIPGYYYNGFSSSSNLVS